MTQPEARAGIDRVCQSDVSTRSPFRRSQTGDPKSSPIILLFNELLASIVETFSRGTHTSGPVVEYLSDSSGLDPASLFHRDPAALCRQHLPRERGSEDIVFVDAEEASVPDMIPSVSVDRGEDPLRRVFRSITLKRTVSLSETVPREAINPWFRNETDLSAFLQARRPHTSVLQEIPAEVGKPSGSRFFQLRRSIGVAVGFRDGVWTHEYPPLGILAFGLSEEEAREAFNTEFASCWRMIAEADDSDLTREARELKRKLTELVAGVVER